MLDTQTKTPKQFLGLAPKKQRGILGRTLRRFYGIRREDIVRLASLGLLPDCILQLKAVNQKPAQGLSAPFFVVKSLSERSRLTEAREVYTAFPSFVSVRLCFRLFDLNVRARHETMI